MNGIEKDSSRRPHLRHSLLVAATLAALQAGVATAADSAVRIQQERGIERALSKAGWQDAESHEYLVPESTLIVDNLQSRQQQSGNLRYNDSLITGFGMPGLADQLEGEPRPDDEAPLGILWSASPIGDPKRLTVTGTYLQSEESPDPLAPAQEAGSATGISIDSEFPLAGALRLHAEAAYTNHDADGAIAEQQAVSDTAFGASASYQPRFRGDTSVRIEAGYREVGPDFHSVANSWMTSDQRKSTLSATVERKNGKLQAELDRTVGNVNGDSDRPTQATDSVRLRAEYAPVDGGDGGFSLFANPNYSLEWDRSHTEDIATPDAWLASENDSSTVNLAASFTPGRGHWSLQHSVTRQDDLTDRSPDGTMQSSGLNISVPLDIIDPMARLNTRFNQGQQSFGNGLARSNRGMGLQLTVPTPTGWFASLSLDRSQMLSGGTVEQETLSTGLQLNTSLMPNIHRGATQLWFGATYTESESIWSVESTAGLQIQGGVTMELKDL